MALAGKTFLEFLHILSHFATSFHAIFLLEKFECKIENVWIYYSSRDQFEELQSCVPANSIRSRKFDITVENHLELQSFTNIYTVDKLTKLLVSSGCYRDYLQNNFQKILFYLIQAKGLFGGIHSEILSNPQGDCQSQLIEIFHGKFIQFCSENKFLLLLWKYIYQYRQVLNSVHSFYFFGIGGYLSMFNFFSCLYFCSFLISTRYYH